MTKRNWEVTTIEASSDCARQVMDHEPKLDWMQKQVGGHLELVFDVRNVKVYADEDGLEKILPLNVLASALTGFLVVGNVIVVREIPAL